MPATIYLDNAATSWPKPAAVYDAVDRYQRELGAPAGRSAYHAASTVERAIADARRRAARLIGAEEPRRVIFTFNGTDSLNLAIHGALRPGDHVVTTVCEHNSVLRPLRWLEECCGVEVSRVACDGEGFVAPEDVRAAVRQNTRLIAVVHASNVTGAVQPVAEIGAIAREAGALFLIDAAQSLGHLPIDVQELHADLLAAPGHKGLLGPLGTGVLYVSPAAEQILRPLRQGGTGTKSDEDRQPDELPEKFESGNLNAPGLFGLSASLAWLEDKTVDEIQRHEQLLTRRLLDGLGDIDGISLHGPRGNDRRTGVVSLSLAGYDPREAAAMLDSAWSIAVRGGIHCAPLMHRALGTDKQGGTVRFSVGPFNTEAEVDAANAAVKEMAAAAITASP